MSDQFFLGLHLSGPNSDKTCGVLLRSDTEAKSIDIEQVYEKIGSTGTLFSDERLVEIIKAQPIYPQIVVDCPISVPACVRCDRSVCPGVTHCDDVAVAYMLSLYEEVKKKKKSKRKRLMNPQTQRVWDLIQLAGGISAEPSYSANKGPLVVRANVLQKRLAMVDISLRIIETHIPSVIARMIPKFNWQKEYANDFRHFERGLKTRSRILRDLRQMGFGFDKEKFPRVESSIEVFQAAISGFIAFQHSVNKVSLPPESFIKEEGWVYLPEIS